MPPSCNLMMGCAGNDDDDRLSLDETRSQRKVQTERTGNALGVPTTDRYDERFVFWDKRELVIRARLKLREVSLRYREALGI